MRLQRVRIPRRTVLRGLGLGTASIGLPTLEAMVDGRGNWYRTADGQVRKPPVRLVLYTFPNGVTSLKQWSPSEVGSSFSMTPCLEPLTALKGDITIVSGLRHTAFDIKTGPAGMDHAHGNATLFVGVACTKTGAGGPSLDQVVAARQGGRGTRFSSMQILANAIPSNDRVPHVSYTSWAAANRGLPATSDPRLLFDMITGGKGGGAMSSGSALLDARRRSILDHVIAEAQSLRRTLGARDRERMEAHLETIREVEKQLGLDPGATAGPICDAGSTPASGGPEDDAKIRMVMRLAALALRCDVTRIISLQFAYAVTNIVYRWLGLESPDHSLSHGDQTQFLKVTRYKMQAFASFLELLKDTPDGTTNLLHNTLAFCGSEVGTGDHNSTQMPVLLAGNAGGVLRSGRHLAYPAGTPLNRLFFGMLEMLEMPMTKFGIDGDRPLPGLLG